ncbi:hypothetical protein KY308_01055 [Candidatus Woesearchaeota archaeon]|nr:hypothetical protein [Candidatus Woesearchaeota archaeon]
MQELIEQGGAFPQMYRPISPEKKYNRDEFVYHQDALFNLAKQKEQLDKDPTNLKAREKISARFFGDKTSHTRIRDVVDMKVIVREIYEGSLEAMARYTDNNFDEMFNDLDERGLQSMLFNVPLYQTNTNTEHNLIVGLINEVSAIEKISKEKDIDKMRKYLAGIVKEDKSIPEYAKRIIKYLSNSNDVIVTIFAKTVEAKNGLLNYALTKDGKFDMGKARALIKDSLKVARDDYDDEENEGKKSDIWEDAIMPYNEKLAEALFITENAKYESEHKDIDDMNKREVKRKAAGLPV